MINVTLTVLDILIAHEISWLRRTRSRDAGLRAAHGLSETDWHRLWRQELQSAAAEIAFSSIRPVESMLGVDLDACVDTFHAPDLIENGLRWQVRHTEREDGRLIVRPSNDRLHRYVLVTGEIPNFQVVGWIWGYMAQSSRWWREGKNGRPGAWFVPQWALHHSFDDLVPSLDEIEGMEGVSHG